MVKQFCLIGATLSGNKGAEGMIRATIQSLEGQFPDSKYDILSIYPEEDRRENDIPQAQIVPCKPLYLMTVAIPLAILHYFLRHTIGAHTVIERNPVISALARADVAIDICGVAFADGRGIVLAYNSASILLPILMGKKVIKFSQALGPFNRFLNRFLAILLLGRLDRVVARGRVTKGYLRHLGLANVVQKADIAFSLEIPASIKKDVGNLEKDQFFRKPIVGICPSTVVQGLCEKQGIDYVRCLSGFIDVLTDEAKYNFIIFPHSVRPGVQSKRNNDTMVCEEIHRKVVKKEACRMVDQFRRADELRELIGHCQFLIVSRFHGMISALSKGIPFLLLGWGHKYREVIHDFGLPELALDFTHIELGRLLSEFRELEQREKGIQESMQRALPDVLESSASHIKLIKELLG